MFIKIYIYIYTLAFQIIEYECNVKIDEYNMADKRLSLR